MPKISPWENTLPSESNLVYIGKKNEPYSNQIYLSREGWVILILNVLVSDFNPAQNACVWF